MYDALQRRAKDERRSISNLCNILIEDAMQLWLDANPPEFKDPATTAKAKGGRGKSWSKVWGGAADRPWELWELWATALI